MVDQYEKKTHRASDIGWLRFSEELEPFFARVFRFIIDINSEYYKYDIELNSPSDIIFQVTKYNANEYYDWHMDIGEGEIYRRKLSFVLQLTSDNDHVGGGLEFFMGREKKISILNSQGAASIFPSWMYHRALPVEKGTRLSLVTWILGSPFK